MCLTSEAGFSASNREVPMGRPLFRIPLPCETSAKLDELAAKHGTTPAAILKQGIDALVSYDRSRQPALA